MLLLPPHALSAPEPTPTTRARSSATDALRRAFRAADRQRQLLHWNQSQPRPAGCWVPRRAWRRHSALLSLRQPDAAPRHR